MKGGLYGRTAYFFMVMLTYYLLRSFSFIEGRDLTTEVIRRRGIGLPISSRESKPYKDIIDHQKVGGVKLYPGAEVSIRRLKISPKKLEVEIIQRNMKENAIGLFNPMLDSPGRGNSPGVGHGAPPP